MTQLGKAHDAILKDLMRLIRDLAQDGSIGKTDWIIMGDHVPPFQTSHRSRDYLDSIVPYVVLKSQE